MPKCKITVLKRMLNQDLAEEYRQDQVAPCESFTEGQEFIVDGFKQPENFCGWAWNDIQKVFVALMLEGNFAAWMKDDKAMIACCTDGLKLTEMGYICSHRVS